MVIDEQRQHVLTNFNPIRNGGRAIESDHNTEILELIKETLDKYRILNLCQCSGNRTEEEHYKSHHRGHCRHQVSWQCPEDTRHGQVSKEVTPTW